MGHSLCAHRTSKGLLVTVGGLVLALFTQAFALRSPSSLLEALNTNSAKALNGTAHIALPTRVVAMMDAACPSPHRGA